MEKKDIESAIHVLETVRYVWADQIPNDNQEQSDYDAITQSIKCLEEYLHEKDH